MEATTALPMEETAPGTKVCVGYGNVICTDDANHPVSVDLTGLLGKTGKQTSTSLNFPSIYEFVLLIMELKFCQPRFL
jgi:hypothetical protein